MGALHNDLERCQFMYTDDRRCRNLIETPGSPLCCYHNKAAQKKADRPESNPATDAFFDWLSHHALDTAAHINQALNQVCLLTVADRISARKADSLTRMLRLMLKTIPTLRDEFRYPVFRSHAPGGERFLSEIRPTVLAAAQPDPPVSEDSFTSSTSSTSSTPNPSSAPATRHSPAPSAVEGVKRNVAPPSRRRILKTAGQRPALRTRNDAASCMGARSLPRRSLSGRRPAAARKDSRGTGTLACEPAIAQTAQPRVAVPPQRDASAASALKRLAEQAILDNVRQLLRRPSTNSKQKASARSAVKGAH